MRKCFVSVLLCASLLAFAAAACAADNPEFPTVEDPILLTPFGQSQDANAVKLMAKGHDVTYDLAVLAKDVDWSRFKTMIIVLGGSGKGLGAAGLDIPSEVARCTELLAAAKEKGVFVMAMHIGGNDRRGPNSQPFLVFAGEANYMVVRADGNADGYFTDLCKEKNVPLYTIEKTTELRKLLAK